ncbi:MAG: hypothetical protein E6H00_13000 [Bacillati bacterium ANGP1]|uniref:DNA helicase DnaB-like N-terminal domain-containing protein n=1 Tax=Candidatus Segetimicrobium genomatis TaxID=2569760 RepID=A0A537JXW4_9BACT|nr:MAG: hypothetical protein E6H00_13000 [Terrabacteria group bacterium ANGP1]
MTAPARKQEEAPQLPANIEAERAILGAILMDNKALAAAAAIVSTVDFYHVHHKKIFLRMVEMNQAGAPIDLVTLCEALSRDAQLEGAGGAHYIASLATGMPKVSNVEHYARIVREKAVLRALVYAGDKLREQALDPQAKLEDLQQMITGMSAAGPETQKIVGGNGHLFYSGREFLTTVFPVPEQLIEGLIFKHGSHVMIAMPHHLKSWFTLALTMGATVGGELLGGLVVPRPFRTMLVTVEDFPNEVQWRMQQLLLRKQFANVDLDGFSILPRPHGGLDLMQESWLQTLLRKIDEFKPEHLIFDVLRRLFRGDINSPEQMAALCEQVDRLRDRADVATTIVHHENRKGEDILRASAGSFNLPGWANVLVRFSRKVTDVIDKDHEISHVEIEVDHKFARSLEPSRMVLDLASETPLRLEPLEDLLGLQQIRDRLGIDWTARDLGEALDVPKTSVLRRLQKFLKAGVVEKVTGGKRGRTGGLARYRFVGEGE